ncbi:MAG: hypothetical protein ACREEM_52060, partial [Blastocatellia bacterium]
ATSLSRGVSRWQLQTIATFFQMPRACLVECHAGSYCSGKRETPRDKLVASQKQSPPVVAATVKLHDARSWHLYQSWYPDVLDQQGKLTTGRPKPYWQAGWRAQHDRLLAAASAMKNRIPLFINGDLHSIAAERIFRSGQLDLRANPVVSLLTGPLGTGASGWPSAVRGVRAKPPSDLEVEESLPVIEEEGFILADFTPDRIVIRFFRWRADQPEEAPEKAIDALQPFRVLELKRPG